MVWRITSDRAMVATVGFMDPLTAIQERFPPSRPEALLKGDGLSIGVYPSVDKFHSVRERVCVGGWVCQCVGTCQPNSDPFPTASHSCLASSAETRGQTRGARVASMNNGLRRTHRQAPLARDGRLYGRAESEAFSRRADFESFFIWPKESITT